MLAHSKTQIGCLRTRVRNQPIIALYFESETIHKFYNLEARSFYELRYESINFTYTVFLLLMSKQLSYIHMSFFLPLLPLVLLFYTFTIILVQIWCTSSALVVNKVEVLLYGKRPWDICK